MNLVTPDFGGSVYFKRCRKNRISTGSLNFDFILGGGLPLSSITDVYGAAGTGKTQFAFQNAIMNCKQSVGSGPNVVFIDCTGSFRPERIEELAISRTLVASKILDQIYFISVRSVGDQIRACDRIYSENIFSECRLVIIDDVTSNFVFEFGEEQLARRQHLLAIHLRSLSRMAQVKGVSILLTNSTRFRGEDIEGESTGEVLSQYSLYRMHFVRKDRIRYATLLQPETFEPTIRFEIENSGIH